MATGKKFYWMKLSLDFMKSDTVDYFMGLKNGANYVVLYQMLCLKTINTSGKLSRKIGNITIPFDIEKIQRDCKFFTKNTIKKALELYQNIGLIYEEKDGTLVITNHKNLVGSETDYARQKQAQRGKETIEQNSECEEKAQNSTGQNMDDAVDNVHTEIRDKRLEKDIRDKRLDIRDRVVEVEDKINYNNANDSIKNFGNGNLLLTDNQVSDLIDKLGFEIFEEYTKRLNNYIADTGYSIKSHYDTILKWYNEDRRTKN